MRTVLSFLKTVMVATAFAGLLISSAPAQTVRVPADPDAYPMYGSSVALLVTVTEYEDSDWDPLHPFDASADRLQLFLEAQGFRVERISNPTGEELREAIGSFVRNAPPDARALIYLAGHGWTDRTDQSHGYFVPSNGPSPEHNVERLRAVSLDTYDIRRFARASRARHTLFLVDSCMSASLFASAGGPRVGAARSSRPDIVYWEGVGRTAAQYVTAGDETQTVPANSPLIDIFIQGIREGAGHPDQRFVTMGELSSWIKRRMRNDSCYNQRLRPRTGAIPLRNNTDTDEQGEMVFLVPDADGTPIRTTWDCDPNESESPAAQFQSMFTPARFQIEPQQSTPTPAPAPAPEALAPNEAVIDRVIEAPYADTAALFEGIEVYYYRKAGDRRRVLDALDSLDVVYRARPAQVGLATTNTIACHRKLDPEVLRTLALALIDSGVEIRRIDQFERWEAVRRNHIEIVSDTRAVRWAPLTRDQIAALDGCPRNFHNPGALRQ